FCVPQMYPGSLYPRPEGSMAAMPKELTALAVAKLKPHATRYATRVARNLYVIVQPSGSKSWAARFGGEKLVLGSVDFEATGEPVLGQPLPLHGAKQLASQVLREREAGRDPIADHKARKLRQRTQIQGAEAYAFSTLARRYIDEYLRAKRKARSWR